MSDDLPNTDGPLVSLVELRPDAAAYELSPGKVYIIVVPDASVDVMWQLQEVLAGKGINGVVCSSAELHIFGLETTKGAVAYVDPKPRESVLARGFCDGRAQDGSGCSLYSGHNGACM